MSVWRDVNHTEYTKDKFSSKIFDHDDLHHKDQNLGEQHHKDVGH